MDLRQHRDELLELLATADLLIHGYRPGAMDGLGLGEKVLHAARPGLVEVMLDAYGWAGPWHGRRGFDSLVQMSSGVASPPDGNPDTAPTPLPVQGPGPRHRIPGGHGRAARHDRNVARTGLGSVSRISLARIGMLLEDFKSDRDEGPIAEPELHGARAEQTFWGPGHRLPGPVAVGDARMSFGVPAAPLGSAPPAWV